MSGHTNIRRHNGRIEKKCTRCGCWKKRKTEFGKRAGGRWISWCRKCAASHTAGYRARSENGAFNPDLRDRVRACATALDKLGSESGFAEIRKLFKQQKGRCYYTDALMRLKKEVPRDPLVMTIEVRDPEDPPEGNNLVLCCLGVKKLKAGQDEEFLREVLSMLTVHVKQGRVRRPSFIRRTKSQRMNLGNLPTFDAKGIIDEL